MGTPVGGFDGLLALHQRHVRTPEPETTGRALHPRGDSPPADWQPTFGLTPYRPVDPSTLALGGRESFHDLDEASLRAAILRVVDREGPVHFDLLGRRLLEAADVGRMGSRIRARIEGTLEALDADGELTRRGPFVGSSTQFTRPRLRDWSPLPDAERKLDHVPDTELMLGLFQTVLDAEGIAPDQAMNDGIHQMGFIRLTDNARERLQAPLQALLDRRLLRRKADGGLAIGLDAFVR